MYYVYFLEGYTGKTYIGCTNNFNRRLRQHNGIITGGAKSTKTDQPYNPILFISGIESKIPALKLEWKLKHPYGKKKRCYNTIKKFQGIRKVLEESNFDELLILWIDREYSYLFKDFKKYVIIEY